MKKNHLKYLIDTIIFVDLCSIAAVGFLLGFVVPTGRQHPVTRYFLGLRRHEWADIHFYLAILFLVLLSLHLSLNWTWIVQSTKRYFGNHWKNALWCISGAWALVLLAAWIAAKK